MTPQIAILVEGQTEEAFVKLVLQPFIGFDVAYLTPIVVHTSRTANGTAFRGGGSWRHYETQLKGLLGQSHWHLVTTMIDFYGYPSDGPACSCDGNHRQPACVDEREKGMKDALSNDKRFRPFVALHEFETLVIAAGSTQTLVLDEAGAAETFRELVAEYNGDAELINNGPTTAPSKRVLAAIPDYRKVRDAVEVLEHSLPAGLTHTPRFRMWVEALGMS
ncbi:DUF4276 family protein [Frondihabitans peucedani]|uniref:DUF4276 family protein n=1 Tax=Frondihabitans peucedani TaxID=598626 RepID=A0ABP8DZ01_9MICO